MLSIRLLTRAGGYVATVRVPPFEPPAEVIGWGSRVFVRSTEGEYREGVLWTVLDDIGHTGPR